MFKVIAKTALKTLLAAVIILCVAFGVASLGFPASMAGFFEKCGNYSFATGYASLSYTYSGKVDDLARCLNDSIMAGNDGNTVHFGNMLLDNGGFNGYCAENNGYRQFACGKIAAAKYRQGDKQNALLVAKSAFTEGGFPVGNALVELMITAESDKDMLSAIKTEVGGIVPEDGEREYYEMVLDILNNSLLV
ncbi:MAG: hypothetical protein K2N30_05295 [Clostridia bacterium]|nr:hypothetical protein [Clostridia bacterium]